MVDHPSYKNESKKISYDRKYHLPHLQIARYIAKRCANANNQTATLPTQTRESLTKTPHANNQTYYGKQTPPTKINKHPTNITQTKSLIKYEKNKLRV